MKNEEMKEIWFLLHSDNLLKVLKKNKFYKLYKKNENIFHEVKTFPQSMAVALKIKHERTFFPTANKMKKWDKKTYFNLLEGK